MPKIKFLAASGNITESFCTPINALKQIKLTALSEKELNVLCVEMDKIKERFEERKKIFKSQELNTLKELANKYGYTLHKAE